MTAQSASTSEPIPIDPARWPLIFVLLSMDVVVPFYELMGLRGFSENALRDSLRAELLKTRRKFASGMQGSVSYSPEETFAALRTVLGVTQSNHLRWWGQRVFAWDIQEHRHLRLWEALLRYLAEQPEKWLQLHIPERLSTAARQRFLLAIDRAPYDEINDALYGRPLSDWDLHMYAVNLFDDEDPAGPTGPSSYVYPTFKHYQGYTYWAWLGQHLTAAERDNLRCQATNLASQIESLKYLGELPPQQRMEIGL